MPDPLLTRPASDTVLKLAVHAARRLSLNEREPQPGDLVVETTLFRLDPDAIGWLVDHGEAAYAEDGTGPTREVWDIAPLSGRHQEGRTWQRWENADFRPVPEVVRKAMPGLGITGV